MDLGFRNYLMPAPAAQLRTSCCIQTAPSGSESPSLLTGNAVQQEMLPLPGNRPHATCVANRPPATPAHPTAVQLENVLLKTDSSVRLGVMPKARPHTASIVLCIFGSGDFVSKATSRCLQALRTARPGHPPRFVAPHCTAPLLASRHNLPIAPFLKRGAWHCPIGRPWSLILPCPCPPPHCF